MDTGTKKVSKAFPTRSLPSCFPPAGSCEKAATVTLASTEPAR